MRAARAIAGWVLATAIAHAQGESVFTTSYAAPAECPREAALRDAIAARLGDDAGAERPTHFRIAIEAGSGGYVALARFDTGAGRPVVRQVVAPDCAQAVEGVALVCALAIGGDATEPDADPPPTAAPASSDAAPTAPPPRWRGALEVAAAAAGGVGPRIAPGLVIGARWAPVRGGPELRLSSGAFDGFEVPRGGAEVRFQQLYGRLEVCANQPFPSQSVRVDPCLGFEGGVVSARGIADGDRILKARSERDPWLAFTVAPWLRWMRPTWFLAVGPELRVPVLRRTYRLVDPISRVHSTPTTTGGVALGAGVRF